MDLFLEATTKFIINVKSCYCGWNLICYWFRILVPDRIMIVAIFSDPDRIWILLKFLTYGPDYQISISAQHSGVLCSRDVHGFGFKSG